MPLLFTIGIISKDAGFIEQISDEDVYECFEDAQWVMVKLARDCTDPNISYCTMAVKYD